MEAMSKIVPLTVQWLLCLMVVEILTREILDAPQPDGLSIVRKKLGMLIVVSLGYIVEGALAPSVGVAAPVGTFYIVLESLAILENLSRLGVPLPRALVRTLRRMRG
jgi:phage-related holin